MGKLLVYVILHNKYKGVSSLQRLFIRIKFLNVNSWGGTMVLESHSQFNSTQHASAGMYKDSYFSKACTKWSSVRRQKLKFLYVLSQANIISFNLLCVAGHRYLSRGSDFPGCSVWMIAKQLSPAQNRCWLIWFCFHVTMPKLCS